MRYLFCLFIIVLCAPSIVYAGGAIAQRQAAIEAQKQAYIQAVQEQALRQRQELIQQQQEEYMRQQQEAYVREAKRKAQQAAYQEQLRYQEAVKEAVLRKRQQAYEQAAQQALAQQQQQNAMRQAAAYKMLMEKKAAESAVSQQLGVHDEINPYEVHEEVTLNDIWKAFEESSEAWLLIMEMRPKALTVQRYIDWYREQGVDINKSSLHYAQMIDTMSADNPSILYNAFKDVIKLIAIIEYDFDDGTDKDYLARKIFGNQKMFIQNRLRLGMD